MIFFSSIIIVINSLSLLFLTQKKLILKKFLYLRLFFLNFNFLNILFYKVKKLVLILIKIIIYKNKYQGNHSKSFIFISYNFKERY
jgi:hypothetical protein